MDVLGVAAGLEGEPNDGVLVDPGQPAGLADADAFLEVGQHGHRLVVREAAVEQRRAVAFAAVIRSAIEWLVDAVMTDPPQRRPARRGLGHTE